MKSKARFLVLIPLLTESLQAGPARFSGSASIYAESDEIQGAPQGRPGTTLRLSLNPKLTLHGLPLSLNLFLSSEESNLRQALNRYRILLQPSRLIRGAVSLPGLVFSISGIEIGTCYPDYSRLTLRGVPITGGSLELNPGPFYLAFAGGRAQRAVEGSDTTEASYLRRLYAGRVGLGKKNRNHVFLTVLYASDDPNSITPFQMVITGDTLDTLSLSDSVEVVTPKENYVIGIEAQASLFEERLALKAEVVGCEFTRDVRSREMDIEGIPSTLRRIFRPRLSSGVDYAYFVQSSLNVLDTKLYGSLRMVGPGFQSLGALYLRKDELSSKGGVEKSLLGKILFFSLRFERDRDNLLGWKDTTTFTHAYWMDVSLYLPNYQMVQASYSPYIQQKGGEVDNRTDIVSFMWRYSRGFSHFNSTTNLYTSYQKYREATNTNNYTSHSLTLDESLNFTNPWALSLRLGYTETSYGDQISWLTSLDLGGSYSFPNRWNTGFGLLVAREEGDKARGGIYLRGAGPLLAIGNLRLGIEKTIYKGSEKKEDYNELLLRAILSTSW